MAFISQKDRNNALESVNQSSGYVAEPDFWEVYSANVGTVIDENLSISRTINSEAYRERSANIMAMVDSGEVSREIIDRNRDKRGRVDWGRIADQLDDDRVPTDQAIQDDINYTLKLRREYAQDVTDRGSGLATFLGQANAYMLDPVNIATMFAGGAGIVKAGASGVNAVMQAGVRGGVLAAGSETLIQPLVYDWKNDIDSPYSGTDAISSIAMAAIGGAALDSTITGIGAYVRRVRGDLNKLEDAGFDIGNEGQAMKNALDKMDADLQAGNRTILDEIEGTERVNPENIQMELDDLKALEREKVEYNSSKPDVDMNQKPRLRIRPGEDLTGNARIRREMEQAGFLDAYNRELEAFEAMDDVMIDIDGKQVSAKEFAKQLDDDVEVIEQLSRCAIG